MGRPKATLTWRGETFVGTGLRLLQAAGCAPLILVCGTHGPETRAVLPPELDVVHCDNPAPDRGQLSSLKIALRAVEARDGEPNRKRATRPAVCGALVALVDQPAIRPQTLAALVEAATPGRIVVPRHAGRRGHPVVFGRDLFGEILATDDQDGARRVVRADPGRVITIETDDPAVLLDVDTPRDLDRLEATLASSTRPPRS